MRFGVEIELDSTDGRDFAARPLAPGEMPEGSERVASIVSGLGLEIQTHGWRHNHNNSVWICKPDSSCGMELCSPVMDESRMGELVAVMDALAAAAELTAGPRCSLHVHVDVSHMVGGIAEASDSLCSVLAWWIKSEPLMLASVPPARRNSGFCRCIGMTDLFDHEERVVPCLAVSKLRDKYLSLNTHHLVERKRNSVEFRILEGTKDSSLASSWIGFVLNFVRRASARPAPENYRWVDLDGLRSLVDSDAHMGWIESRIGENFHGDPGRFWGAIFGRTPPYISTLVDT
jgi:hypothetical protein